MKVVFLITLLALIGCGAEKKKSPTAPTSQPKSEAVTAPAHDKLSILSHSVFPEKMSLRVNGEEIFDECMELPLSVAIDRDIQTIEVETIEAFEYERLFVEIRDRGADCTQELVYYIHDNVDFEVRRNWDKSRTMFARLNNFPREPRTDEQNGEARREETGIH